jgi:hypothetical protein
MSSLRYTLAGTQQGSKLVGTGGTGSFINRGYSVALSADGNTLAIGGPNNESGGFSVGTTWIYTRSGTTWTQQARVTGTGAVEFSQQGQSLALSADGNTLAVGGPYDNSSIGATWIFTRSGSTWTQHGSKLVGTGYVDNPNQGWAVALSADGNTLAVGGPYDNIVGATWIFTRSGSTWTQQGSKLIGTGGIEQHAQGTSVALSADGNTLAIGGPSDNSGTGATWIFTRSGSTWTQQGSKIVGTGATGAAAQGYSVALSANGNTLAAAGYQDNSSVGATWVFTRSGTNWTQQGSKLVGTGDLYGVSIQGNSIDLSGDGNVLAVGGPFFVPNPPAPSIISTGATWIFTRTGTTWTQQYRLIGTGNTGESWQGYSVALSGTGSTLAVGGIKDNSDAGATWVFV